MRETWDPFLEPWVGHDQGTVTVLVQGLVLMVVTRFLLWLLAQLTNKKKKSAIVRSSDSANTQGGDDDDDDDWLDRETQYLSSSAMRLLKQPSHHFDGTVLLCGPAQAGKTSLLIQLLTNAKAKQSSNDTTNTKRPLTVTSLKANVAVAAANGQYNKVRYIDWPGHASKSVTAGGSFLESNPALYQLYQTCPNLRIVLVLDATQSVKDAAAILYQVWNTYSSHPPSSSHQPCTTIVVACHKSDTKKAKNVRRLQLQLRTELEKLLAVQQPEWWPGNATGSYELDNSTVLPPGRVQWQFVATSCFSGSGPNGSSLQALQEFAHTGSLPQPQDKP